MRKRNAQTRLRAEPIDDAFRARAKHLAASKINTVFHVIGRGVAAQLAKDLGRFEKAISVTPVDARTAAEGLDLSGFADIAESLAPTLSSVALNTGQELLTGYPGAAVEAGALPALARDWAARRAAELVGMQYGAEGTLMPYAGALQAIDNSTVGMVERMIVSGAAEGLTAAEVADQVAGSVFGPERAAIIAGVEVERAASQGLLQGAQLLGAVGISASKAWETMDDGKVCADICALNEAVGPIGLHEDFPSGDNATPGHPFCRCRTRIV